MTLLTAVLVGQDSLLVECATVWLKSGHQLAAVVSPNPAIRGWAAEHGVTTADFGPDLVEFLTARPFDYLFNVTNLRRLPTKVFILPTQLAINFHDALLPRDAGRYAATWAIVAGAQRHGVTWHVMTEDAAVGDVLVQREVAVTQTDTSYTLNVKCRQAGVESFAELAGQLSAGQARQTPQDLQQWTYHARTERPPAALVLSWEQPAEALAALVRASEFGPSPNEFGTAKVATGSGYLVVGEATVCSEASTVPAGTVVEVTATGLQVATVTHDLRLTRLSTLTGAPVSSGELHRRWDVRPGCHLAALDTGWARQLTLAYRDAMRYEPFWVQRLSSLTPLDVPFREPASEATGYRRVAVNAPVWITGSERSQSTLLAATLAFLVRMSGGNGYDVALRCTPGSTVDDELFASSVPLRVPGLVEDFTTYLGEVEHEVAATLARSSHLRDVVVRYPQLRTDSPNADSPNADSPSAHSPSAHDLPVAIDLTSDGAAEPQPGTVLHIQLTSDGRCVWLVAGSALPEEATRSLHDTFVAFLHHLPRYGPFQAPLLAATDRERLYQRNDTATAYPAQQCTHQLFIARARHRPHAPAVAFGDQTLTYGELDRLSSRLARTLVDAGVGPGELVGVHLERSLHLLVALLAVMKTGAAYVPLDPSYPRERIGLMLTDAGTRLVLTQSGLATGLPADIPAVLVDQIWSQLVADGDSEPFDRATATDLAYVIYTSGSTGIPNGVRIGHRALTNVLCSMARTTGFEDQDRMLAVTTVCFDIAGLELYLPLITGGQVEIAAAEVAADGAALRALVERSRPTVVQATPATWRMLLATGWSGDPGLRVFCGGEAMPADLADELIAKSAAVWNLYGPTETTIWSTASPVRRGTPITLGTPIANTTLHVLDARMNPVPDGIAGELFIGGDGLAEGYHHRPELTAERFRKHPHTGERLYRTGDLVRYTRAGDLHYLGRLDHQVTIRGFRVELGEIEICLAGHPDVTHAVVMVRSDVPGEQRLVAYVVPPPGHHPAAEALRAHAATILPDYMVPATIVTLEALPRTPHGKVDRNALPAPDQPAGNAERKPQTPTERLLCTGSGRCWDTTGSAPRTASSISVGTASWSPHSPVSPQ